MNALRQISCRTANTVMRKPASQQMTSTFHHRLIRAPSTFSLASRRPSSGVFGHSVVAPFIQTSLIFYAIPITAAASPYFNMLPFDVLYGAILPYHAYVGMSHIFTDYAPKQLWLA